MKLTNQKLKQIIKEELQKVLKEQAPKPGGAKCLLPNLKEVPMREPFQWEDGKWYKAVSRCSPRDVSVSRGKCDTGLADAYMIHVQSWATSAEVGEQESKYKQKWGGRGRVPDVYKSWVGGTWVDTGEAPNKRGIVTRHGVEKHRRVPYCVAKPAAAPKAKAIQDPRLAQWCAKCKEKCGQGKPDLPAPPP